ncbi:vesicle transport protein USE1-like [Varroa jacobsoni]|uniref:vesicle transport protein USE1-like n=1 Tax=Varroa jacobsoni TaxID=62625 RepID=UPI000BF90465|nr:vesicle transport protein USE1-like [Varroa jacobsoni]
MQPLSGQRTLKTYNEIKLCRLLSQCEALLLGSKLSWRLQKYVVKLEELLKVLEQQNTQQPSLERLAELRRKVAYIVGVAQVEKVQPEKKFVEQLKVPQYPNSEVRQRRDTRVNRQIRDNLLGRRDRDNNLETDSRRKETKDVDQILQEQDAMQQHIAESMVSLAQDLKRNALTAKQLIVADTEVVRSNLNATTSNYIKLQKESERLEKKLKFSCSCHCTMWLMLVVVCIVFLQMVVFIRLFPKRY